MADTSDFKRGMAIIVDGEVCQIVEFQHVKPGKGGAFVRTKLRRLRTGGTIDKTFRAGEKVEDVFIEKITYQFLYKAGTDLTLMDVESFDQVTVPSSAIGDGVQFMKEETEVMALVANGETLGYEVPQFAELAVAQTDPGERGNTVSGSATKPATLETGAVVNVPFHINEGDIVKVDTTNGQYLERVSKR
ncbi:MAG: elongation factor P [Fimbriimonadaceae bacterium]|nr:elongation factor P [Fimbriimonadaceae bacterium]